MRVAQGSGVARESVRFPSVVLEQLVARAREGAPLEVCGILAVDDEGLFSAYPLSNVAASETYYSVDPTEQFETYTRIRDEGLAVAGVYHSHPASPARPSTTDIAEAYDSEALYVIVSLQESPEVRAWRIAEGVATEVDIEPVEG